MESPLKWQTRVVSCVKRADQPGLPPVQAGFAVGSIEGRVAFQYIKEADKVCVKERDDFFHALWTDLYCPANSP